MTTLSQGMETYRNEDGEIFTKPTIISTGDRVAVISEKQIEICGHVDRIVNSGGNVWAMVKVHSGAIIPRRLNELAIPINWK